MEGTAAGPPERWGRRQGRPDDVISGVGGYISGAHERCSCCCRCCCSVRTQCSKAAGRTDGRTHAETHHPRASVAVARPAPRVRPPLSRAPAAPSPRPPSARRSGFVMRSAAVLALLLCAGQGERARSLGGEGPGRPLPALACACPAGREVQAPRRAARRSTAPLGHGQFSAPRTAPPPPS